MIKSFKDKETERIFNHLFSKKIHHSIQRIALRKLVMLDHARALSDLKVPPSNKLEELRGDREGQHSIRINDQYRICFTFIDGDCFNVEIIDYH